MTGALELAQRACDARIESIPLVPSLQTPRLTASWDPSTAKAALKSPGAGRRTTGR